MHGRGWGVHNGSRHYVGVVGPRHRFEGRARRDYDKIIRGVGGRKRRRDPSDLDNEYRSTPIRNLGKGIKTRPKN